MSFFQLIIIKMEILVKKIYNKIMMILIFLILLVMNYNLKKISNIELILLNMEKKMESSYKFVKIFREIIREKIDFWELKEEVIKWMLKLLEILLLMILLREMNKNLFWLLVNFYFVFLFYYLLLLFENCNIFFTIKSK